MTGFITLSLLLFALACVPIARPWWPVKKGGVLVPALGRWALVGLLAGVATFTVVVYVAVGTPRVWLPVNEEAVPPMGAGQPAMTPEQIDSMVQRLAARLKASPDDMAGWRMLVRSYETLGRYGEAVQAWQPILKREPDNPDMLVSYAVTLGMSLGQSLAGEPEQVINRALQIQPNHIQALALSGSVAFEQGHYARAVAQWRHLLTLVPADDPVRASIEGHVAKAEGLMAKTGSR